MEDRENRGWEIRRIGGGRWGEQRGDEENREWEIGRTGGGKGAESQRGKGGKWERQREIMNVLYFAIEKELKRESQEKGSETGNAKCGKVTGGIFQIWSTLAGYEEQARRFKP